MAYGFNEDKSKAPFPVILWENPDTGNNEGFEAQTVALSDEHTNYDYLEIIAVNIPVGKLYGSMKIPQPAMIARTINIPNFDNTVGSSLSWCGRDVQFLQNSTAARKQAVFSNGWRVSIQAGSGGAIGKSTGATYCIPVAIIGYKYN